MIKKIDFVRKRFAPMLDKTLKNAIAHRLRTDFPRIGGPRILDLCAEMILEVVDKHLRSREHVKHGQIVWLAYDINDPPRRHKRTADTKMVPVILDVSTPGDVEALIARTSSVQRVLTKALRMCRQAYEQGGLLSNVDLSEILGRSEAGLSHLISMHEDQVGVVVPRRATLHDVGSGVTHKRIICRKRYLDGKVSEEIARETHHSLEAVDHYLGQFDRVRHCLTQAMSREQISYTLRMSPALLEQYILLDQEIGGRSSDAGTRQQPR